MENHRLHLKKKERQLACAAVLNDKHYPLPTASIHDLQTPNSKHSVIGTSVLYILEAFFLYQPLTLCISVIYVL